MLAHKWLVAFFLLVFTGAVVAADTAAMDALRARFPRGIPWKVEVINPDGTSRGELETLITSAHASSCMGEIGEGFRVEITRLGVFSPPLHIASYGIARFTGDKVKIDLRGGTCDAYLVMSGVLTSDGMSSGDVYTLGPAGEHDVGTYRAIIR